MAWDLNKQVIKVGEAVTGTVALVDPDPRFKYELQVTGSPNPAVGPNVPLNLTPTERGLNRIYVDVTVKDGQGNVIGRFQDPLGRSIYVLPANTTAATLQWSQQAFAALQINGDAIPAYQNTDRWGHTNFLFDLNNRISRAYAAMYNKDPDAYAWCGLAAYVSSRAGQGIAAAGMAASVLKLAEAQNLQVSSAGATQMYDAFTKVNEAIFLDMYRQFVAYDGGGIAAIQAMANEQVILPEQLAAWQRIDAGRQARTAGNAALAAQEFWGGNLALADVEQNVVAQRIFDGHKPIFLFLTNDAWFKTQFKSPVPGDNSSFGDVVPNGVNGGQANVAVREDRWQWLTAPNTGLWDKFKAWQPTHRNINPNDVTNTGLQVSGNAGMMLQAFTRLGQWRAPA